MMAIVVVLRIVAAAVLVFWAVFALEAPSLPPFLVTFEQNFVVADLGWLVPLLLLAARWLATQDPRGPVAGAAGAGALVFLGLLDAAFNARFGQYSPLIGRGALNLAVNAGCVGVGAWVLVVLARQAGGNRRP